MKVLIVAALVAMTLAAPSLMENDGRINFEYDSHPELPVGLTLQGQIDPKSETSNKISAFLRLANQFIPILEALDKSTNLEYTGFQCWGGADTNFCVYYGFQLVVGWRVYQGGYTSGAYNITYVPFAEGYASANMTTLTWPVMGTYGSYLNLVRAYAPIGVQLYTSGQVCFGGYYYMLPTTLTTNLASQLKQCYEQVLDDIVIGGGRHVMCSWSNALNFTHLQFNFTNYMRADFLQQTCFG